MRPPRDTQNPRQELFKQELSWMLDPMHKLVKLAERIDWDKAHSELAMFFADNADGQQPLSTRLVVGLLMLKEICNVSDEEVVERWIENPYWQYFCGEQYFQRDFPCHRSSLTRWRKRLGVEGCEKILKLTIQTAETTKQIVAKEYEQVIIDTTVQEKAIAYPTDAQLLNKGRIKLVGFAQEQGIALRQNYNRTAKKWLWKISQLSRSRKIRERNSLISKLRNRVGRVLREVEAGLKKLNPIHRNEGEKLTQICRKIYEQRTDSKDKIYSLHEEDVACIAKGKASHPYEFGNKVSLAMTKNNLFIVGVLTHKGNPHDSKTLRAQINQVENMTGHIVQEVLVDKGYRGHGIKDKAIRISGQRGQNSYQKKLVKRRSAIEPMIGHCKTDGHLGRCFLKGFLGSQINAILVAVGHNLRKILNKIFLFHLFVQFFQSIVQNFSIINPLFSIPK